jgi:hypothetical protein
MSRPDFQLAPAGPGAERAARREGPAQEAGAERRTERAATGAAPGASVHEALRETQIDGVLAELDAELVGLAPVKTRLREIAPYS